MLLHFSVHNQNVQLWRPPDVNDPQVWVQSTVSASHFVLPYWLRLFLGPDNSCQHWWRVINITQLNKNTMRRKWFTVETSYCDWVTSGRISVVHACLWGGDVESWCGCGPCGPSQPARGGGSLWPSPAPMESRPATEKLDIKGCSQKQDATDKGTALGEWNISSLLQF